MAKAEVYSFLVPYKEQSECIDLSNKQVHFTVEKVLSLYADKRRCRLEVVWDAYANNTEALLTVEDPDGDFHLFIPAWRGAYIKEAHLHCLIEVLKKKFPRARTRNI